MSKKQPCPHCNYEVDTHSSIESKEYTPSKGDVSICIKCAGWNKFDDELSLIKFTDEDEANSDPELITQMKAISLQIKNIKEYPNGRTN